MSELPDWMYAPRIEGWYADDLDHLPQAPPHTELLHGSFVFRMAPERPWHSRTVRRLATVLGSERPGLSVRLDQWNRAEPDVVVLAPGFDAGRVWCTPADVLLVVEVVSPESDCRDFGVKIHKYSEAGIPHYWIVEEGDGLPVVHVFELEQATSSYAPAGIFRGRLERSVPFPISIDLGRAAD